MKSPIITKEKIQVDINDEIMGFALKVGTVLGALIGFWAVSCLVAGLISVGPLQMARGYITAITGF
jgi:hypothetical protein